MQVRVYRWPAPSNVAVAALQTLVAAGNLSINGTFAVSVNGGTSSVTFNDYSRVVSLTSANNLSGVNFTVTGTLNGAVVSETIAGPNVGTVSTTQLFNTVTSISASAAAAAVSAGIGATGNTAWFNSDTYLQVSAMTIQVVVTGAITYTFATTLDDVNTITAPTSFAPIPTMLAATTNRLDAYFFPARYSNITVNSGTGSLVATFLQQGVKV